MAVWFVDTENMGRHWMPFLDCAAEQDAFLIFFTVASGTVTLPELESLQRFPGRLEWIPCRQGANALDFQLTTELGFRLARNPKESCTIVSADKGYDSAVEHWKAQGCSVRRVSDVSSCRPKRGGNRAMVRRERVPTGGKAVLLLERAGLSPAAARAVADALLSVLSAAESGRLSAGDADIAQCIFRMLQENVGMHMSRTVWRHAEQPILQMVRQYGATRTLVKPSTLFLVDAEHAGEEWTTDLLTGGISSTLLFYRTDACRLSIPAAFRLSCCGGSVQTVCCLPGPHTLDFQLLTELGWQIGRRAAESFAVVTPRADFDAAILYWRDRGVSVRLKASTEKAAPAPQPQAASAPQPQAAPAPQSKAASAPQSKAAAAKERKKKAARQEALKRAPKIWNGDVEVFQQRIFQSLTMLLQNTLGLQEGQAAAEQMKEEFLQDALAQLPAAAGKKSSLPSVRAVSAVPDGIVGETAQTAEQQLEISIIYGRMAETSRAVSD